VLDVRGSNKAPGISLESVAQTRKGRKGNGNLSHSDPLKEQESAAETSDERAKQVQGVRVQVSVWEMLCHLKPDTRNPKPCPSLR
jgi:hypothetical protein